MHGIGSDGGKLGKVMVKESEPEPRVTEVQAGAVVAGGFVGAMVKKKVNQRGYAVLA